jgi:hypothetical protein
VRSSSEKHRAPATTHCTYHHTLHLPPHTAPTTTHCTYHHTLHLHTAPTHCTYHHTLHLHTAPTHCTYHHTLHLHTAPTTTHCTYTLHLPPVSDLVFSVTSIVNSASILTRWYRMDRSTVAPRLSTLLIKMYLGGGRRGGKGRKGGRIRWRFLRAMALYSAG